MRERFLSLDPQIGAKILKIGVSPRLSRESWLDLRSSSAPGEGSSAQIRGRQRHPDQALVAFESSTLRLRCNHQRRSAIIDHTASTSPKGQAPCRNP